MRILITAPSLSVNENVSGISSVVITIIENNPKVNYIHFLSGNKDIKASLFNRFIDLGLSYYLLWKHIRNKNFDILHLNLPLNYKSIFRELIVFLIVNSFHIPIITHLHGGTFLTTKPPLIVYRIVKYILSNSNKIIVLSDLEKILVTNIYNQKSSVVLKNTINVPTNNFTCNKNSTVLKLIFLGRLHESKGLKIIFDAVDILNDEGYQNHIDLSIYGKGPLEDLVVQKVNTIKNISFHGVIKGVSKFNAFNAADVFLLPSLYGEGLPIALLESMGCGVVPIVTNDGSMIEVVKHNQNGIVVEKNSATDLASKIKLLLDSDLLKSLSQETTNYFQSNFDLNNYITTLNSLYYSVLKH
ncbi:glycosyltransferase [Pontibacter sp. CAU 1760]